MLKPVSALNNASYASGIASVNELDVRGMITLRGDLSLKALTKAAGAVAGVSVPEMRHCALAGTNGLAWMSPDELLLMCAYEEVDAKLAELTKKLSKLHALAVNVSDARAVFEVRGPHAREVMAKVAPVDLAPSAFTPGMFRRSRIAQVPAAFWMPDEEVFHVVCFRSVARYVLDVLSIAAAPGSEVEYF